MRLRSLVVSYYITLSFVRLRSSQLVTSFVRLHGSTTFVCETLQFDHIFVCETSHQFDHFVCETSQFDHFVCETSQFDHFVCETSQNELMKSHNEHTLERTGKSHVGRTGKSHKQTAEVSRTNWEANELGRGALC